VLSGVRLRGQVSISVDASWGAYEKGVYAGCGKSNKTVIDHAVQVPPTTPRHDPTPPQLHYSVSARRGEGPL
jgi:hypothetical protein